MDKPTQEHHLHDLGSTGNLDPTDVAQLQDGGPTASDNADQPIPDADPSVETLAGNLGLEGSADNPTRDDHFTGGSR